MLTSTKTIRKVTETTITKSIMNSPASGGFNIYSTLQGAGGFFLDSLDYTKRYGAGDVPLFLNDFAAPVDADWESLRVLGDISDHAGLGSERITNSNFDDESGWTEISADIVYASGVGAVTQSGSFGGIAGACSLPQGLYKVRTVVVSNSAGTLQLQAKTSSDGTGAAVETVNLAVGTSEQFIYLDEACGSIKIQNTGSANSFELSEVSFKLIEGRHMYQNNSSYRPQFRIIGAPEENYLHFNGSSQYMNTIIKPTMNMTIAFCGNLRGVGYAFGTNDGSGNFGFAMTGSDKLLFGASDQNEYALGTTSVKFTDIAVILRCGNNKIEIFLNGELEASADTTHVTPVDRAIVLGAFLNGGVTSHGPMRLRRLLMLSDYRVPDEMILPITKRIGQNVVSV